MTIDQYIDSINKHFKLGYATEHTFRGDLQQLIETIVPTIRATNEPKRQTCGAPDYILTKKDIPIGFIEAKDLGDKDLEGARKTGNKEQFDRYKASLNNLIFTDYLDFHLYREGQFVTKIAIADITPKGIKPIPENFARFENLIKDFCTHIGQTIKSSKKLAEMMAGKARLLSEVIEKALTSDETHNEDSTLKDQMNAFKQILIHDITPKSFADVYAQTIAYGMFAARYHDPTLPTFSRQEAYELIPKSNPFLKKLFGYIAGLDVDDRIRWIVDDLVNIFLACNVVEILRNYGKSTKTEEPIIHFYETFLSEYDSKLRKSRGVWYTPHPVVSFQVRAIDEILKTEFGLPQGIADSSKIKIKVNLQGKMVEQEVHRVQMLDPATGTASYIAEVIKEIYKKFEGQQGIWSSYVENHLLPRLIGFELLMASYAMAHLQIDLLLKETGFSPTRDQRLKIYLTNSLEESHPDTGTLFANWLSNEANEANHIKRDVPVMIVMGNPPYAVSSTNKNEWIQNLITDYKKDLNERKINLDDDYIKFIRFGQHYIDKNGSGILAYISNNSFIDGITHRQMRKSLLESFDKIYILDLHGNAKKQEVCPDGSVDQNVFDIMQGVSINIFVKTGKKKRNELGQVFHSDLQGKREFKYETLNTNSINSLAWCKLEFTKPNFFFVPKNFDEILNYEKGFKVDDLFAVYSTGAESQKDDVTIHFTRCELNSVLKDFRSLNEYEISKKYDISDGRDWKIGTSIADVISYQQTDLIQYRPFDIRHTLFSGKSKGFFAYTRFECLKHLKNENLAITAIKLNRKHEKTTFWITKFITDKEITSSLDNSYVFPLYLYSDQNTQHAIGNTIQRTPNLNPDIVNQIAEKLGLKFTNEKNSPPLEGCPQGGVVHSNTTLVNSDTGVVHSNTTLVNSNTRVAPSETNVDYSNLRVVLTTINNTPIYRNFVENLPHNPALNQLAKDKRKEGILSEVLFWQQVHKGAFHNIDFDRQRIIGNYIVDFYIKTLGLIIEVDGSSHNDKFEYDAKRQSFFESYGLKVFRCTDIDVKKNISAVFRSLEDFIVEEYGETTTPAFSPVSDGETTTPAFSHPSKGGEFAPIDVLDYIYAVLHSPTYREKYKEFLKIDFPRVPYPKDKDTFWQLVKLGGEIRQIHLLESPKVESFITQYPIGGDNVVNKPRFISTSHIDRGRVYINDTQYFDFVPEIAWNFYIGGYQPAQKWLKDRKDRKLEFEDILHYQKIIVALTETDRLMKEIDKIEIE